MHLKPKDTGLNCADLVQKLSEVKFQVSKTCKCKHVLMQHCGQLQTKYRPTGFTKKTKRT